MFNELHEECGVFGVYQPRRGWTSPRCAYYGLYALAAPRPGELRHRRQRRRRVPLPQGRGPGQRRLHPRSPATRWARARWPSAHVPLRHHGHRPPASTPSRWWSTTSRAAWRWRTTATSTNAAELRSDFELEGSIFHTTSDTEVITYAITRERIALQLHRGGRQPGDGPA